MKTPPRMIVKICGLTTVADARACRDLGADYLGLVFAAGIRAISPERGALIREAVPEARLVGVFVDEDQSRILSTARRVGLDLVQLHGNESPDYCSELRDRGSPPLMLACRPEAVDSSEIVKRLATYPAVDHFLFDLPKGRKYTTGDRERLWTVAAKAVHCGYAIIVAGALNTGNVAAMRAATGAYGADVSRGVESRAGIKNLREVERFIREAGNV